MRIQILKETLVEKTVHSAGDVVVVDRFRGKDLIEHGAALEVKVYPSEAFAPVAPDEPDEPDEPVKREAVVSPKTRKAVLEP